MEEINHMAWVEFYAEFADHLLQYKNKRAILLDILQTIFNQTPLPFPRLEKDGSIIDIDPFTVFGMFNKGIKDTTRREILTHIAKNFHIKSKIPQSFEGIPLLNNLSSIFYAWHSERNPNDINNLWNLFEVALSFADNPSEDKKNLFIQLYNNVLEQKQVKWNITMGLFWIRAHTYLNLDSRNRHFLCLDKRISSCVMSTYPALQQDKIPQGETYLQLCINCNKLLALPHAPFSSFPQLSYEAWLVTKENHTQRDSREKKNTKEWIIPSNPKNYDIEKSFLENQYLDWHQTANYNVGDIVYIYSSSPIQRIQYKTRILQTEIPKEQSIDDGKFWTNKEDYTKDLNHSFIRLALLQTLDTSALSLTDLKKHGLKAAPQGPLKVKKEELSSYLSQCFQTEDNLYQEELENKSCYEGAQKTITVNTYERNPVARKQCLEHFGSSCQVCGLDFEKMYGAYGKGFIHVHHIKPISEVNKEYIVDPIHDLIPVCPNCHAMLHSKVNGKTPSVEELKAIIHAGKKNS